MTIVTPDDPQPGLLCRPRPTLDSPSIALIGRVESLQ